MDTQEQQRDPQLWKMAIKRSKFKKHLFSYIVINAFLWALWYVTEGIDGDFGLPPWPVWPLMGWGIGVAFDYFDAYHTDHMSSTQKEYDKLKREKEGV